MSSAGAGAASSPPAATSLFPVITLCRPPRGGRGGRAALAATAALAASAPPTSTEARARRVRGKNAGVGAVGLSSPESLAVEAARLVPGVWASAGSATLPPSVDAAVAVRVAAEVREARADVLARRPLPGVGPASTEPVVDAPSVPPPAPADVTSSALEMGGGWQGKGGMGVGCVEGVHCNHSVWHSMQTCLPHGLLLTV